MLCVLNSLVGVLTPNQSYRNHLRLRSLGHLVHPHVFTKHLGLSLLTAAPVLEEGRPTHQDAAIVDAQGDLGELFIGHEHFDDYFLGERGIGGGDEAFFAVGGD